MSCGVPSLESGCLGGSSQHELRDRIQEINRVSHKMRSPLVPLKRSCGGYCHLGRGRIIGPCLDFEMGSEWSSVVVQLGSRCILHQNFGLFEQVSRKMTTHDYTLPISIVAPAFQVLKFPKSPKITFTGVEDMMGKCM